MWFASGLVMIYVPFPELSRAERLAGLPPIDWRQVRAQPAFPGSPRSVTLEMRGERPVWRIVPWDGDDTVETANDGNALGPAGAGEARRIAELFGRAPVTALSRIERDQWTVAGGFNRHRPLWKAEMAGSRGRVLYVSSRTGAVVLDTDRNERFWNWLGSVPHWLYPTVLRQDNAAWRQVVLWVSGPCMIAAATGLWIGVLRTRLGKRRFRGGRMIPYRGWMEWHHVAGLIGGITLLTWIFSGWLSVDPGRLFESGGIGPEAAEAYAPVRIPADLDLASLAVQAGGAGQVEFTGAAGRTLALVRYSGVERALPLDGGTLEPLKIDRQALLAATARLVPGSRIAALDTLTEPDAYWYEVGNRPLLPVLRLRFDDPARTWAYVDPATGQLLMDIDARRRLYRWLFDLLHKWDFNALTLHRPSWDLLLWLFSLLGLVTSVTAVRIGWARLRGRRLNRPRWSALPDT